MQCSRLSTLLTGYVRLQGEPDCAVPDDWERYPLYLSLLEEVEEAQKKQRRQAKEDAKVY